MTRPERHRTTRMPRANTVAACPQPPLRHEQAPDDTSRRLHRRHAAGPGARVAACQGSPPETRIPNSQFCRGCGCLPAGGRDFGRSAGKTGCRAVQPRHLRPLPSSAGRAVTAAAARSMVASAHRALMICRPTGRPERPGADGHRGGREADVGGLGQRAPGIVGLGHRHAVDHRSLLVTPR